jgi:hypothetical protein
VTGTIATAPIGLAVGAADSEGAPDDGVEAVASADEDAAGLGNWPTGPLGLPDGVGEPTSPPATLRMMATQRTARTVIRGSRFTAAIVTAEHSDCPAPKPQPRPSRMGVPRPRLRSSRMGDAGKASASTGARAKRVCAPTRGLEGP